MYLRIIFLTLFSINSYALNLKVHTADAYELVSNEKIISLNWTNTKIRLEQNKCNKAIIENFNNSLEDKFKRLPKRTNTEKPNFSYLLNNRPFTDSYRSRLGRYILDLPHQVKALALQNKLLCN